MVFSSLFFVLLFLPLCLIFYYSMPSIGMKNIVLLVFSLIFYMWAGPTFILVMLADALICYFGALLIGRSEGQGKKKAFLIATVGSVLAILVYFKYTGFILSGVKAVTGFPEVIPQIILPIGISFYTFQLISYVADVYRGEVKVCRSFFTLLLYTALFYQCIAGPIVRYSTVSRELVRRRLTIDGMYKGMVRFCTGLAKKAVLANACASLADELLAAQTLGHASSAAIIAGVFCYTLYIYLDFSAYSDMAIGMGLATGFHFPENFNYPYVSRSVTEFWRRWHISLSTFFRDYVYIPLGGNRVSVARHILNLFIVWFLTGLWHGASLNFALWGVYYFILLVIEKYIFEKHDGRLLHVIGHITTPLLIAIGWMLFRFTDMSQLLTAFKGIFTLNGNRLYDKATYLLLRSNVIILFISFIACMPLYKKCLGRVSSFFRNRGKADTVTTVWNMFFCIFCLIISVMALIGDSYNPFLYFRF
ncbi:MAG: MBOAT family protein [Lachnospiraceae bacterium]|nr:MBOAT family protein [Lachnospiraceae bacterium]